MVRSLIDTIGRKKASKLMENAVLRAIDENQALGLEHSAKVKKMRIATGELCIVNAPLIAVKRTPKQAGSLKQSVPVA